MAHLCAMYATGVPAHTLGAMLLNRQTSRESGRRTINSRRNKSMVDVPDGTGLIGVIGTSIAGIAAGILLLRKYLSSDSVERAGNDAQLQIIQMLQDQVKQERARADEAVASKDRALEQIAQLRAQVAELSLQVQNLKIQITAAGSIHNG